MQKLSQCQVRWTWGRKWGITRISFVVSRYLPLVGVTLMTYFLLLVRTYVFWGCDKRFLIVISVFSMVTAAAMLTMAGIDSSKVGNSTGSTRRILEVDKNAGVIYGLLMFFELGLLSLTLYKRFKTHRLGNTPIVVTIYRDGVIYMLCITLVSMLNCIVIFALPSSYNALLIGPQVVAHSALASRILFNLRAMDGSRDVVMSGHGVSDLVFAQPIQTRQ
ncbi:hypothetical protein K503DRAFT_727313 [Rhizopogon vinicolor AM-OR11-026]|uniref:Uncharacterized protein n=1 Tax=Rhizopogon vinicolor AM-OR11-026 TaxID=1314800 RepID=A0A1B7MHS8_9AGAM|nr:hypothetical protein K503DRAFT_727313 [Rhizopogon vinicolor AM-OR11-026]